MTAKEQQIAVDLLAKVILKNKTRFGVERFDGGFPQNEKVVYEFEIIRKENPPHYWVNEDKVFHNNLCNYFGNKFWCAFKKDSKWVVYSQSEVAEQYFNGIPILDWNHDNSDDIFKIWHAEFISSSNSSFLLNSYCEEELKIAWKIGILMKAYTDGYINKFIKEKYILLLKNVISHYE